MPAWLRMLLIAVALVLLALAYQGYLQPGLLLNFLDLRYCG